MYTLRAGKGSAARTCRTTVDLPAPSGPTIATVTTSSGRG